jgi:PAS domain S-box-containing protein
MMDTRRDFGGYQEIGYRFLLGILVASAAALAFLAFRPGLIPQRYAPFVVPALLAGLVSAVTLHLFTFARARAEQKKADSAFDASDREFASVLKNTLDGILILDNHGICLDANPAAFRILRTLPDRLINKPLSTFYRDPQVFEREWTSLRQEGGRCGKTDLVGNDGAPVFVDYAFAADCVPGRHLLILCDMTRCKLAETSLRNTEEQLEEMADHVQEIFWRMDAVTKKVVYVSKAYEAITGRPLSEIHENPSFYKELIYPDDRVRVLTKLDGAAITGRFDEEFRIAHPDGIPRWVRCTASLVSGGNGPSRWLVGVIQDITSRKNAESEVVRNLAAAVAAQEEADALRKATLTLTQNLRMDALLDTLLATLHEIVPYDSATVLLAERDGKFLLARQVPQENARRKVTTVDPNDHPLLQRVCITQKTVFVENTSNEPEWRDSPAFVSTKAWICVPLVASGHLIGLLSVSSKKPGVLTHRHLRLAKSLAFSAAVAIQNARLYERAEIYAEELQMRLRELSRVSAADILRDERDAG